MVMPCFSYCKTNATASICGGLNRINAFPYTKHKYRNNSKTITNQLINLFINQTQFIMKKKLFSLMMMCLFAFGISAQAQSYNEVGYYADTTTYMSVVPTNTYYNYSLTQQIYTVEELGPAGNITSLSFKTISGGYDRILQVYLVQTDKADFEDGEPVAVTAGDLVYCDSVSFTAGQWTTITLDAPFAYDGVQNLAVVVNDTTGDYESSTYFRAYAGFDGTYQSLYAYRDNAMFDATNPDFSSLYQSVGRNVIRFGGLTQQYLPISDNLPLNSYYKFGLSQQIYTAADIDSTDCDIVGFSFYNMGATERSIRRRRIRPV